MLSRTNSNLSCRNGWLQRWASNQRLWLDKITEQRYRPLLHHVTSSTPITSILTNPSEWIMLLFILINGGRSAIHWILSLVMSLIAAGSGFPRARALALEQEQLLLSPHPWPSSLLLFAAFAVAVPLCDGAENLLQTLNIRVSSNSSIRSPSFQVPEDQVFECCILNVLTDVRIREWSIASIKHFRFEVQMFLAYYSCTKYFELLLVFEHLNLKIQFY